MRLTVSKRFEFSASRRLYRPDWTEQRNLETFGAESSARFGVGQNYAAYFVFSGPVNPVTGMLINVSDIKERVNVLLNRGYDHKFLNGDNAAFAHSPPTVGNVASQLLAEATPSFADLGANLVACHLSESPDCSATAYGGESVEVNYWTGFSAARQTMSPRLTEVENRAMFGTAASPSGHGHNYRLRITIGYARDEEPRYAELERCLLSLHDEMDHRNLNVDVPGLQDIPKTTECIGRYLFHRALEHLPVLRVRLYERDDFFAEYHADKTFGLGLQGFFNAAHRLHSHRLTVPENEQVYGKCRNERGHGHRYLAEATVSGSLDELSGTLYNFTSLQEGLTRAVAPFHNRHLDREVQDFAMLPSTGENILHSLWPKVDGELNGRLARLRLWETPNNRFTLRR